MHYMFQVSGVVLAVHPLVKTVHVSLLPHLVEASGVPANLFPDLRPGAVLEGPVVIRSHRQTGVFLTWNDKYTLHANVRGLSYSKKSSGSFHFELFNVKCKIQ